MKKITEDKKRGGSYPLYQFFYRIANKYPNVVTISFLKLTCKLYHCEIYYNTNIGRGLYIGHPYCITINPNAIIGNNVNIHKGVTIGCENRGIRCGSPQIGDCVWIGINSTIVGNIKIGDDVLIAPNTYINCDVPAHSIVFGNPCIIKPAQDATSSYITNIIKV